MEKLLSFKEFKDKYHFTANQKLLENFYNLIENANYETYNINDKAIAKIIRLEIIHPNTKVEWKRYYQDYLNICKKQFNNDKDFDLSNYEKYQSITLKDFLLANKGTDINNNDLKIIYNENKKEIQDLFLEYDFYKEVETLNDQIALYFYESTDENDDEDEFNGDSETIYIDPTTLKIMEYNFKTHKYN